ncbi:MAG: nucleotidyltransferase domain-containing protein [bacterium]|nr:nucleotidyltransferase domain-containing protein [bacterium]
MNFNLTDRLILLTLDGSRAYGMNIENSDVDLKGVCIPPLQYYLGFKESFEQADSPIHMNHFYTLLNKEEQEASDSSKLEGSVYELRKFFKLATDNNPNILSILFCRDEDVRFITPIGQKLRDNRDTFLSTRCRWTFSGYARSQLNRIESHRKWLLNPITHRPTRAEFGLAEVPVIDKNQLAAAEAAVRKKVDSWEIDFDQLDPATKIYILNQLYKNLAEIEVTSKSKFNAAARLVGYEENFLHSLQKEREYKAAYINWKQYCDWKINRNKERAVLEAKCGYDTKNASHLIRLFRMCSEILEKGNVNIYREDAGELLDIRNGKWSYDKLIEFANNEEDRLDSLFKNSSLPRIPPIKALDDLCVSLIDEML